MLVPCTGTAQPPSLIRLLSQQVRLGNFLLSLFANQLHSHVSNFLPDLLQKYLTLGSINLFEYMYEINIIIIIITRATSRKEDEDCSSRLSIGIMQPVFQISSCAANYESAMLWDFGVARISFDSWNIGPMSVLKNMTSYLSHPKNLIWKAIRSSKNLRIHPKLLFGGILGNLW